MQRSPFFDGVSQLDFELGDHGGKLPVFYYDAAATAAFFPAKLSALRRLMPDRRISPARLAPAIGVVGIVCLEYRDSDIGPYNEVAIVVALNEPWFLTNLPGRATFTGMRRRQLHSWIHHMPVTSEVARATGRELYNFPKFIAGIDFERTEEHIVCRLHDGEEPILTLSGKRIPTPRTERLQLFSHLWMHSQRQCAESRINAVELGMSFRADAATLELGGRHPVAQELDRLLVSRRPTQYVSVPRFESILFGPEHLTVPSISHILGRTPAEDYARIP